MERLFANGHSPNMLCELVGELKRNKEVARSWYELWLSESIAFSNGFLKGYCENIDTFINCTLFTAS